MFVKVTCGLEAASVTVASGMYVGVAIYFTPYSEKREPATRLVAPTGCS